MGAGKKKSNFQGPSKMILSIWFSIWLYICMDGSETSLKKILKKKIVLIRKKSGGSR